MDTNKYTMPLVEAFGEFVDVPAAKMVILQAEGGCPYVVKARLGRVPDEGEIEALGFSQVCSTVSHQQDRTLRSVFYTHLSGEKHLHLSGGSGEMHVAVAARSQSEADEILRSLSAMFVEVGDEPDPSLVPVRFSWYASGPRYKQRMIESPEWDEVATNYPAGTREALKSLHDYNPEQTANGRLLMFHGVPGTGKTTAVRSLARAWSPWCAARYIVDPEALFSVPEYLLEVALENPSNRRGSRLLADLEDLDEVPENGTPPRWQLVIVEDVDELIRADAKDRTGQALGRLLNLTDGLLGQGLRTLFLLTTNERMGLVHPAVSRPGRCLANIEFSTFTKSDAETWLQERGSTVEVKGDQTTLAELYALCGAPVISADIDIKSGYGTYL